MAPLFLLACLASASAQLAPPRAVDLARAEARLRDAGNANAFRNAANANAKAAPAPEDKSSKIVGGTDAAKKQYPWMAALFWPSKGSNQLQQQCGGQLVDENWVLSAAHCVEGRLAPEEIIIGAWNLRDYRDEGVEEFGWVPEKRGVSKYVMMPTYNKKKSYNDLVLLQLDAPSTLAPLRVAAVTPVVGTPVRTMGYGDTTLEDDTFEIPGNLQSVDIDVIDCSDIAAVYDSPAFLSTSFLCASEVGSGKDSCQGDSGGPLITGTYEDGFELVGIVSWGYGCGGGGVYTDVADYTTWIADTIESNGDCADSAAWVKKKSNSKGCEWIAKKQGQRCGKVDTSGERAADACKAVCGCEGSDENCADDETWFKKGQPSKDCAWVSEKKIKRCKDKDADGVKAKVSCPVACGRC
ncbi:trypsin-like cysteine/serine peptidase domain-containing protein [Pelagophyceae sp. CCMP2097]|nr:trypsin-like cysteine/serine peptidase domain-containing protein [Pelagophyceae sp. CCMP2097]